MPQYGKPALEITVDFARGLGLPEKTQSVFKSMFGPDRKMNVSIAAQDDKTIVPEGVKVSTFNEKQREILLGLVSQWVGMLPNESADAKMAEIKTGLGETWLAWSGPTTKGSAAYFRIQGPAVFIEYAPQRLGGDPTQHIHTIYRDPTNEYGRKWWKQ